MSALPWVLIIVLHGWGAGIGSSGNAIDHVGFTSRDACETAVAALVANDAIGNEKGRTAICVRR